ncbi:MULTISPECIES: GNAT family N-acetyltransferase [Actinosynnema]|uniref:GNAT family N-acetyltransferase n=1 Tax=Actinosynnema TaxID=40566 RepID=UPI0020A2BF3B|nr:GNAT family N-acetyltransferase [Actinosynnema pretiosum]MCP2099357.1 Ribosomal protein S18 acetylase RimI [Actinosynnema pretiosum]
MRLVTGDGLGGAAPAGGGGPVRDGAVELGSPQVLAEAPALAGVLVDAVAGGASLGFLAPLTHEAATAWWRARAAAVANGRQAVWAARRGGEVVGTVLLTMAQAENGRHRAEVGKLAVRRDARGAGVGRSLLRAVERGAVARGVTLLVLDTETGSPAEGLYRSAGWSEVGSIPGFAAAPSGEPRATTVFYKAL